jgi:hypothetical protein
MAVVAIHLGASAMVGAVTCTSDHKHDCNLLLSLEAACSIEAAAIVGCFYSIDSRVDRKLHKQRYLQRRTACPPRSFQRPRFCRLLIPICVV